MARANDLDDFLSDLTAVVKPEQSWDIGQRYLASLGFDLCCYEFGDWDRDPDAPYRALTNNVFDWVPDHFANLNPESEPLLAYGCRQFKVQPMGVSFKQDLAVIPRKHRSFLDRLADSGWRSIIAFPLRLRGSGPFGGWAIASENCGAPEFMKRVAESGAQARLACFYVHEKLGPLEHHINPLAPTLTPRQKDCLLWLARGLRQAQIAERLGISLVTVEFHLRTCRQKLDARTNLEAISKAIKSSAIAL